MATVDMDTTGVDREVGAAFVAAGIGSLILGILVVLADASAAINNALVWSKPVGNLSGKTGIEVIAFFVSWALLHLAFRGRNVRLNTAFTIGLVLVGIGILLTFPPVFDPLITALKPLFGG